ncbi:MAG: metal-dependent transcriptional regulator [Clostridia bacterium]
MEIQESGENYLETILFIKEKKGHVHSVDIVEELNLAKSSVSRGVNVLKDRGFITMDSDGAISFTDIGRARAIELAERHHVLTDYFISLGVNEKIAEADACKIEHDLSRETFEAIKKHAENLK